MTKYEEEPVKNDNDLIEFDATFEKIIQFSKSGFDKSGKEVSDRFVECLYYNLIGGKKNRGLFVVKCFKELNPNYTFEQLEKARIIGWCVELFQAYFLVHDDIMDDSITRRGQQCWFRRDDVGLVAINDANYLQNLNFTLLRNYLGNSKCYLELVELFLDMYRFTVIGQTFDLISNPPGSQNINFDSYTLERYNKIVKYKTAYYTFSLPIRAALYLSGIKDIETHKKVEDLMLMIGKLFQIQDDYLDLYGDPKFTGKIGTDIQEGKCSWLIVNALKLADKEQLNIIKENYGKSDIKSVNKIKKLFEQLRLKQLFFNLEENSYRQLKNSVIDFSKTTNLPESALSFILATIYKRVK